MKVMTRLLVLVLVLMLLGSGWQCNKAEKEAPPAQTEQETTTEQPANAEETTETEEAAEYEHVVDQVTGNEALQQGQNMADQIKESAEKHNQQIEDALNQSEQDNSQNE